TTTADIVSNEKCGVVVQYGDAKKLHEGIIYLTDKNVRKKLGYNSLKATEREYNWKEQEKELIKVYDVLHENLISLNLRKQVTTKNILRRTLTNSAYLVYCILRCMYFNIFFYDIKKDIKDEKIDILFLSFLINWRKCKDKNGKIYEHDLMIGDVIKQSKECFYVRCMEQSLNGLFRAFKETHNKFRKTNDWICAEQFIDISSAFKAFFLSMKYLFGSKIGKNFEQYFSIIDRPVKASHLLELIIADKIISQLKPKVLFLTYEYDLFHRALTYTAHKGDIPVIALQHGVIHPAHYGYVFSDDRLRVVLPDVTCVFGCYHYNILTEHSIYKPEQVAVTGAPRYDVLTIADKIYDKNYFCNKWCLNPNRKIVLVATENLPIQEENIIFLKNILKYLRKFPTLQIVIKPHPGERGKWYEKVAKEEKMKVTILPKNSDTFEAIYACDLFFTYASTTGMEAVALNKPVIVVNLTGRPDPVEYVKERVALGVYKEEDLKPAVEQLLRDDSELAKNRKKYVEKYLYKIDGKATERIINLIKEVIKEHSDETKI
ncbi:MAG: UDP-N-acetylglucosamine 2-epimerase, partial [Thermoplasmatales archaeon]|nr:UDP-N-acetylglucosamine 2-epimerase [Candidatus Thermoplasmatota archaeon]MCG2825027.1 UDP-N-acetylglucosamine 2-epimerase [Thermoplasmatales archaeon]